MLRADGGRLSTLYEEESVNSSHKQLFESKSLVEDAKDANREANDVYQPTTVEFDGPAFGKGLQRPSRYRNSWRHLIPFRNKSNTYYVKSGKSMPVDEAGCFSFIYFSWLDSIVWKSFRRGLRKKDVYPCSALDSSRTNGARIANIWEEECRSRGLHNASLFTAWLAFIKTRVLVSTLFYIFCLIFGYLSATIFMKKLLDFVGSADYNFNIGITWALALFCSEFIRASCFSLMYGLSIRSALRTKSGLEALLYKKLLVARNLSTKATGEIVNLFANDSFRIFSMVYTLPLVFGGPIIVAVTIIYTYLTLGNVALVGVVVFLIAFILQIYISKLNNKYRKRLVHATDERIALITEMLTYIKTIKLYAWENAFAAKITILREREHYYVKRCLYTQCLATSLALIAPIATTIATILAYTLYKHNLTAVQAFSLVMVNYVAAHGIRMMPICVRDIVAGRIALKRLERLLRADEREKYLSKPSNPLDAIELRKATLARDAHRDLFATLNRPSNIRGIALMGDIARNTAITCLALSDVTLTIPKGSLVGIIGNTGSGKSSLLQALLGQLHLISGKIALNGSVAYVAQEPWLQNASYRNNITFGFRFDSARYYQAISNCALSKDIAELPQSDDTIVGERGVNLSGGQKARLSLARAFYADRDVYLIDDPLSSVDQIVAKEIFSKLIKQGLARKTVLLVTHQLEYLQEMDMVIHIEDGKVISVGSHDELMSRDEEYQRLVSTFTSDSNCPTPRRQSREALPDIVEFNQVRERTESDADHDDEKRSALLDDFDSENKLHFKQLHDESDLIGKVTFDTYLTYLNAAGSWMRHVFLFVGYFLLAATIMFSNWWLGHWINQGAGDPQTNSSRLFDDTDNIVANPRLAYYQGMYLAAVTSLIIVVITLSVAFTRTTLRASKKLHEDLFKKVFQSPLRLFETLPIGRIQNIFTRDIDDVDNNVPQTLDSFLQRLVLVICNVCIVVLVYPWFVAPLTSLAVVFVLVHLMFRGAMRDLRRIEASERAPIYSHVSATLMGLPVIAAYEKQEQFVAQFTNLVDAHSAPYFLFFCSTRWLSTRMDIVCVLITFTAGIFAIMFKADVGVAFAGLAVALSMQLSGLFQYVVRLGCDVETRFTAVERITGFIETFKDDTVQDPLVLVEPSDEWPARGEVIFRDVCMRYRPGLHLALKGVSVSIEAGEKIGIVGRTGAGKSSIGASLLRLVELASGSIKIDGVDISTLSLETLRSRVTIIPQDPVLFRGSVRYNIDPFNKFNSLDLLDALEVVGLKSKIESLSQGIMSQISEGGSNFSAGEKQLLCMARAVLRKSKVVLLDEATASMDSDSDVHVTAVIRRVFADATVLTIAHRIRSVLECDKVMVISDGRVVEFDSPANLLVKECSLFSKLSSTESNC